MQKLKPKILNFSALIFRWFENIWVMLIRNQLILAGFAKK